MLILLGLAVVLPGCGSSTDVTTKNPPRTMRQHEESFDPSAYRPPSADTVATAPAAQPEASVPSEEWVEQKVRTMGFRVQLHSTASLDEAQETLTAYRGRLDSLQVDAGRVDMVFDAPYYKIRAGDFVVKAGADSLRETLHAAGFPEAWVVRDNVFRIVRVRKE